MDSQSLLARGGSSPRGADEGDAHLRVFSQKDGRLRFDQILYQLHVDLRPDARKEMPIGRGGVRVK